jgi:hypothetical protein
MCNLAIATQIENIDDRFFVMYFLIYSVKVFYPF